MNETHQSRFSADSFDKACLYVASFPLQSLEIEGYSVSVIQVANTTRLVFKKQGYSLGFISNETGIVALAKGPDNDPHVKRMEQLYASLVQRVIENL